MEDFKEKKSNQKKQTSIKDFFKYETLVVYKNKIFAFSSFILIIFYIFYKSKERRNKLKELLSNRSFVFSGLIALVFSIWTLYFIPWDESNNKVRNATKHAIIAFLIGMFHHFEFKIGPFWFVWLISYYLDLSE